MENTTPIYTVVTLLLGLWILDLYRSWALDLFRFQVFSLRDRLFDDVADGFLSFDHPAYILLRNRMNGVIRFGHRYSLIQVGVIFLMNKPLRNMTKDNAWEDATRGLSADDLEKITEYRDELTGHMVVHVIRYSPEFMVTVLIPLTIGAISKLCAHGFRLWVSARSAGPIMRRMNAVAVAYGR